MARRSWTSIWAKGMASGMKALRKASKPARKPTTKRSAAPKPEPKPKPGVGHWLSGVAVGAAGARRYKLYLPPGLKTGERVPMIVMLHGCGQDAASFAASTRMNQIAARAGFIVLYPEQDRLANPQGCWNWFDTRSGHAYREAAVIMAAIDKACLLAPVDPQRVAVAGLSAGASMAALLATQQPERFRAVVMHSGIPPGMANSTLSALSAMRGRRAAAPLQTTPAVMAATAAKATTAATASFPTTWPPLLVIHGSADSVVAVRNGRAAAQVWADAAGAKATAVRSVQRGKRHAMNVTDFKSKAGTVVSLVEIGRLGHAWSGGAASQAFSDAQGPDASRMVWAFAARQFGV